MAVTDPISDMIIRIKNALRAKHTTVDVPQSKIKTEVLRILKSEGYIDNYYRVDDEKHGVIRIELKYNKEGAGVIKSLKRVSKPGLRMYVKRDEIPRVLGGLGTVILSTSKGIVTGKQAQKQNLGGELLCEVY
ncbi:MAG TPA: 30S ribosomal protein S8 [bacterium]|nr:30S ribosomal protein S8 [bacterium]